MKNKTIQELEKLIEENNSDAMYELGNRYFLGKKLNVDYSTAIDYFKKAYNTGNIKGKYGIAKCYYYGRGVEKDYKKAFEIFESLVNEYNDKDAKYYIGKMYYYGEYVEKDYKNAFETFESLVNEYNDKDAKYYIGNMYYYGEYVEKDYKNAFEIFESLVNEYSNKYAKYFIGEMYYNGYYVEQDYKKAFDIFRTLFEKENDKQAMIMLADMYYFGQGVQQDYEKALQYYEDLLKEDDDPYTAYNLGKIYFYGRGTEINYEKAKIYFEKSVEKMGNDAYYYLGLIYKTGGYGIEKDVEKSKQYFYNIEKDFCNMLIYYVLALYDENYIEKMLEIIDIEKDILNEMLNNFPQEHLTVQYFNKIKYLKDEQYREIAENVKEKILRFSKQESFISITDLENEEQVDIFCEIIIFSSDYENVEAYLEQKANMYDARIFYLFGNVLYEGKDNKRDVEGGLEFLQNSADKGYPYAKLRLAEIKYYENDLAQAECELKSLLQNNDEILLRYVRQLLEKIYYEKEHENKTDNRAEEAKRELQEKQKLLNYSESSENNELNSESELTMSHYLDQVDKKDND